MHQNSPRGARKIAYCLRQLWSPVSWCLQFQQVEIFWLSNPSGVSSQGQTLTNTLTTTNFIHIHSCSSVFKFVLPGSWHQKVHMSCYIYILVKTFTCEMWQTYNLYHVVHGCSGYWNALIIHLCVITVNINFPVSYWRIKFVEKLVISLSSISWYKGNFFPYHFVCTKQDTLRHPIFSQNSVNLRLSCIFHRGTDEGIWWEFKDKFCQFFIIKTCCGYSLESPQFLWRNTQDCHQIPSSVPLWKIHESRKMTAFSKVEQMRVFSDNLGIIFVRSPQGDSNEYTQHMIWWRNKQNYPLIITE